MFVSPLHRLPLLGRKYSWYLFLLEAESTLGPECGQKDYVNKNFKDTSEMKPVTFWLAVQFLNQMCHHVSPYSAQYLGFKWQSITLCFLDH
jgi:hypothetical protein